jgi:hypothetical protein
MPSLDYSRMSVPKPQTCFGLRAQLTGSSEAGLKHSKEPRVPFIREFNSRWSGTCSLLTSSNLEYPRCQFNDLRVLRKLPLCST